MVEVKDEILNGNPKYRILDKNRNVLYDEVFVELQTEVLQDGTPINKALFDLLQNDIHNFVNEKTNFVLGEVVATMDCDALTITNLDIKKGEEIVIIYRSRNRGGVSSNGYKVFINGILQTTIPSGSSVLVIFARLSDVSDEKYITSIVLATNGVNSGSQTTTDEKISEIEVQAGASAGVKKGNSLIVYKRTA